MKKNLLFLLLALTSQLKAQDQWAGSGSIIYNTNPGAVSIGTNNSISSYTKFSVTSNHSDLSLPNELAQFRKINSWSGDANAYAYVSILPYQSITKNSFLDIGYQTSSLQKSIFKITEETTNISNSLSAPDGYIRNQLKVGFSTTSVNFSVTGKSVFNQAIGIGKSPAGYMLDVKGNISNEGADFVLGRNDGRSQGKESTNGQYNYNRALVHYNNDELILNFAGDFDGGTRVMGSKLYIDGSLAVGTADPKGHKLAVNGSIIGTSFKIREFSKWPDFVFDSTYSLMSLSKVEEFIQTEKHLPGVPSAKEVQENGFELEKMDAVLLKKIEELTLYMIEMNKNHKEEMENLRKENEELKKMIREVR